MLAVATPWISFSEFAFALTEKVTSFDVPATVRVPVTSNTYSVPTTGAVGRPLKFFGVNVINSCASDLRITRPIIPSRRVESVLSVRALILIVPTLLALRSDTLTFICPDTSFVVPTTRNGSLLRTSSISNFASDWVASIKNTVVPLGGFFWNNRSRCYWWCTRRCWYWTCHVEKCSTSDSRTQNEKNENFFHKKNDE